METAVQIQPIFQPLLLSNDRYYFITGGRGSGKSFSVAASILFLSFEFGHTILYTRLTMVSAAKSVIPEFKNMIEKMGLEEAFEVTNDQVINKHSGSKIWFIGLKSSSHANTARLKSLAGVTTWVIDEFEDMGQEERLFDKIDNSIRTIDTQNRVIMIMNPTTTEAWFYDRWFAQPGITPPKVSQTMSKNDTTYIHTTWLDSAEHLAESWINKALRVQKQDPKKYEHTYLGGWLDKAEGVIITNWDYEEFPQQELGRVLYGLDFGFRDPTVLIKVMVDKKMGNVYVKLLEYKTELIETEIAGLLIKHCGRNKVVADGARPEMIEAFVRKGLQVKPADKSPGSVMKGISLLRDHKILVDPHLCNLVSREFNNYVWEDDGKKDYPKQNTNMDHIVDSLRYAVSEVMTKQFSNYSNKDFY